MVNNTWNFEYSILDSEMKFTRSIEMCVQGENESIRILLEPDQLVVHTLGIQA